MEPIGTQIIKTILSLAIIGNRKTRRKSGMVLQALMTYPPPRLLSSQLIRLLPFISSCFTVLRSFYYLPTLLLFCFKSRPASLLLTHYFPLSPSILSSSIISNLLHRPPFLTSLFHPQSLSPTSLFLSSPLIFLSSRSLSTLNPPPLLASLLPSLPLACLFMT